MFAGAGGLSLGFAQAGLVPRWAGELNPIAAATYVEAFPGAEVHVGYLQGGEVPSVDVLIGGPPCQPFSSAGAQLGEEDARDGLPIFAAGLVASGARAFLFEEAPTLPSQFAGYFERVLALISSLGFTVDWRVLDAADYGVAQNRKRTFVVGFRDVHAAARFSWPQPWMARVPVEAVLVDFLHYYDPGPTRHSRPILRDVPHAWARMLNHGRGGVRKGGSRSKSLLYKWTMPHEQAATITVSAETKGSEHALRILVITPEGSFERRLSIPELAALQGFPPDYPWQGSPREVMRQIGNSVAPPIAHALASAMRAAL